MPSPADVLTRMLHAVDALDWATVRACFADTVRTDYTELMGGEPEVIAADDLVARWQGVFPGFEATQHQTGPCVVTDDGWLETHVQAVHHIAGAEGGPVWRVYGHYVAQIVDERIVDFTLQLYYTDGNDGLVAQAAERATTSPRTPRVR